MKRGTASRVFLGGNKVSDDFGGLLILSQVVLGKKSGMFTDHTGLYVTDNVMLGKGIARVISVIIRGTSPLSLPDAIADSLSYVKAFGGTEQRNLPDGYIERQFIYMMDGSYLLTDITPEADWHIEMDFQTTSVSTQTRNYFGSRYANAPVGAGIRLSHTGSGYLVLYGFDTTNPYTGSGTSYRMENNTRYKYVYNNNSASLSKGGTVVESITFTVNDTTTREVAINNYSSSNTWGTETEGIYLYSFKAWNGQGELVMDLVPAVQKGTVPVVGFYDTVSKTFKTATAGTFAAGGEAVPTPDAPMDIVSNNGVLKYSVNMANVNEQTALIGYYISTSGAVMTSPLNWIYQDYIPVEPNTTYTLTMSSPVYFVSISEYSTADDSGFVVRKAGSTGTNSSLTITTRSVTKYLRFGVNIDNNNVTLDKVFSINWMLNKGNSLPYAPYSPTGIYTDGTVETLWMHGKNLFDKDGVTIETGKAIGADGSISNISVVNLCASYIPVSPNTTYTFSGNILGTSTTFFRVAQYKADQTFISRSEDSTGERSSYTFTTGADTYYIRFHYIATADISTYQLEQGSTATTYEPYYDGGTATAEMLLKVGDYQDVQSIIDGVVTRNVGIKVLDGTETWEAVIGQYSYFRAATDIPYYDISASNELCTHSKCQLISASASGQSIYIGSRGPQYNMYVFARQDSVCVASAENVAIWKQWLADQYAAGTPVIVIYPLATATTESVAGQTLQVQDGNNTLEITQASLSNLELEAEYQAAVSLTIQEVQDANLDPNVEVTIN